MERVDFDLLVLPLDEKLTSVEREVLFVKAGFLKNVRSFVIKLVELIDAAEIGDKTRLAMVFPDYVMAVRRLEEGNLMDRATRQGWVPGIQVFNDEICAEKGRCVGVGVDHLGICWNCGKPRPFQPQRYMHS